MQRSPSKPDPAWLGRQQKLYTAFVNARLGSREDVPPVRDLFEEIKDGRVLYALLEALAGAAAELQSRPSRVFEDDQPSSTFRRNSRPIAAGHSLEAVGKINEPRPGRPWTRIDHVANLTICFRYIHKTTKIVGIGPQDIADGTPTMAPRGVLI